MTQILNKKIVTEDEEYLPKTRICQLIEKCLDEIELDTYNHIYIVQVTVDKVDEVDDDLS